eukprot:SAG11_NODE_6047_length_1401_cov_1.440092_1_plen_105_part_00
MGFRECCDEPTPMGNDNWQAVTLVGEDRVTAGNRWCLTEVAYCEEKHREGYTLPYWVETNHNGAFGRWSEANSVATQFYKLLLCLKSEQNIRSGFLVFDFATSY